MKKFYLINITCVILVFAAVICFMTFFPRTYGVAESENRKIVKFPRFSKEAYFSGAYTEQITKWYTDSIPYRQWFRSHADEFKELYGLKTELKGTNIQDGAQDSRPESDEVFSFDDWNGGD